jgi:hypothetical protein
MNMRLLLSHTLSPLTLLLASLLKPSFPIGVNSLTNGLRARGLTL